MFYFDSMGRNTKIVDEKGNTVHYSFDGNSNRIIKISERYGSETNGRDLTLSYNTNGLLEKIIDFKGTETLLEYDYMPNVFVLSSITYAANRSEKKVISFDYDNGYQMTSISDAIENKGQFTYDSQSRIDRIIDPRSDSIYADLDYLTPYETIFSDPSGGKTYYRNNGDLNLSTVNIVEIIDDYQGSNPVSTKYEWRHNQVTKVTEPAKDTSSANPVTTIEHDSNGNIAKVTNPDDSFIEDLYDDKSNLTKSTHNEQQYVESIYDNKSNLIFSSDHIGNSAYYNYDKYGNMLSATSTTSLVTNLISNRNFELYDSNYLPLNWGMRTGGGYAADPTSKYGNRSGKITVTGAESLRYYFQNIEIPINGSENKFTVTGSIKTQDVTGIGAQLVVYFKDSNDQFIKDVSGNAISFATNALKDTNDWTDVYNSFYVPKNTAYIQVLLSLNGAGSVNFDGIQLHNGSFA